MVGSCFVCLEDCNTETPCLCRSHVHSHCLFNVLKNQEGLVCKVCLTEYRGIELVTKTHFTMDCISFLLASSLTLFAFIVEMTLFLVEWEKMAAFMGTVFLLCFLLIIISGFRVRDGFVCVEVVSLHFDSSSSEEITTSFSEEEQQ